MAKYLGTRPEVAGPNCWNFALALRGLLPSLRFTSDDEFTFYLRPPLCRPFRNDEKRLPGDIGAIRRKTVDGDSQGQRIRYNSAAKPIKSRDGQTF